jgi:hypothetical protein
MTDIEKSTEQRPPSLVTIRIDARPGTGKTALGTVIEHTLREAGVNVVRAPLEEADPLGVEDALGVLGEMTNRNIQVALSEHHAFYSGEHLEYEELFLLDHQMPGYVKIWQNGRVVLSIQPERQLPDKSWKPVFLDELLAENLDEVKFGLYVYDRSVLGRHVASLPVGDFLGAISVAKDYLLVWILNTYLSPYSPPLQREHAKLLRKRGFELLDQVVAEHIHDTSLLKGMYREEIKVLSEKLGKPAEPKANRIHIVVEGPGNTGKVAMTHLIAEMLSGLGLPTRRTQFNAPAPEVLGMDNERATEILRELATRDTDRVYIDVSSRDVPRDS